MRIIGRSGFSPGSTVFRRKNYLEKRNNIMQPVGENVRKTVRAANSVVSVFTGCLMAVLFLYGGYSLWDTWRIYHGAFVDDELMELKPVKGEDANPSPTGSAEHQCRCLCLADD